MLHFIAGKRLAAGRLTVVDATNVQPRGPRGSWSQLARAHDVLPVAIVLDVPEEVCAGAQRGARRPRLRRARRARASTVTCSRSLRGLAARGLPPGARAARRRRDRRRRRSSREQLLNDRRDLHRPFDVIGDVHGCRAELEDAARPRSATAGPRRRRPAVDAAHPEGRTAVFVGDLVDRGPDTPGRAAAGDGDGRGRPRALRAAATTRTSWSGRSTGAKVTGQPRPRRDARAARREPDGVPRRRSLTFMRRARQPLRARRRAARRRARRAEGGVPRAGLGPGPRVRAVRRHHRRDRRVRPAGPLPVGRGLPRPRDGRLRPHADARARVGQQHDLPRHRRACSAGR